MSKPFATSAAALPDGMRVKAPTVDLKGQKIGFLTPLEVVGRSKKNSLLWRCVCDCGAVVTRTSASLRKRTDAISSCGCYLLSISRERLLNTPAWNIGKRYSLKPAGGVFRSLHAWSKAVRLALGEACVKCGWDAALCDVHHKVPKSRGGENTISNGTVLCPNCHRLAHIAQRGRA